MLHTHTPAWCSTVGQRRYYIALDPDATHAPSFIVIQTIGIWIVDISIHLYTGFRREAAKKLWVAPESIKEKKPNHQISQAKI